VDRGKARGHGVLTVEEGDYAGYRLEGEWEHNVMRRGELKMKDGTRYVGAFADYGGCFRGRGELWLKDGVRLFDGEWEQICGMLGYVWEKHLYGVGYARRGMAVDSDGAVHRVEFEGVCGAHWETMEQAFDEKQAFRRFPCTGASWTRLPVRARSARGASAMAAVTRAAVATVATVARRLGGGWNRAERNRRGRRRRRRVRALARRLLRLMRNGPCSSHACNGRETAEKRKFLAKYDR
jgi:hypothetical protein